MLQAIKHTDDGLEILDQLKLPEISEYVKILNVDDGYNAIKTMQVRGAPAIAIVGMLSLAEELKCLKFPSSGELVSRITQRLTYLVASRPTAVNLSKAARELNNLARDNQHLDVSALKQMIIDHAKAMLTKDIADNRALADHGSRAINDILLTRASGKAVILTHCNTGSLATAGYGTALGVIRALHEANCLEHVYCTETRPYNQGARLTAYELVHDKIPATLICDNMVALLMERRLVTAVVVGADRVVANGDAANKIGTHQIAIVAKRFNVPFYVCAPTTSIDKATDVGSKIEIEERPEEELAYVKGIRLAAPGIKCWNPSFDVTPADLITGVVTELGVFAPAHIKDLPI